MQRTYLHGLLATWLESDMPSEVHGRFNKPFALGLYNFSAGLWTVRVHLLLDELESVIAVHVKAAVDVRPLRINQVTGHVVPYADGTTLRLVRHQPWAELATAAPADRWTFRFLSPTMTRSSDMISVLPTPAASVRHLRLQWYEFAPNHLLVPADLTVGGVKYVCHTANLRTVTETFRNASISGVIGTLGYTSQFNDEEFTTQLGKWISLAPYAGTGYQTTHGFGVTELVVPN